MTGRRAPAPAAHLGRRPDRGGRAAARGPAAPKDRTAELAGVGVPVLVVQGARDPFGVPPAAAGRDVVVVAGNHALTGDVGAVAAAVGAWLPRVVQPPDETEPARAAPAT